MHLDIEVVWVSLRINWNVRCYLCKSRQTFGTHISMPQERLQVQCVVVLATHRTFILFRYFEVNYVVFQAFATELSRAQGGWPICDAIIPLIIWNGQADFRQSYFHATVAIVSAVLWWCCPRLECSLYSSISERQLRCVSIVCEGVFLTTENLTDMCCQYSVLILKWPGRTLASICPCHRNDCKCSVLWYWRRTEC